MKPKLLLFVAFATALISCQKEIGFDSPEMPIPGGGGGSVTPDGQRLQKVVQVTLNTNDTNIIGYKWNAGRIIEYTTNGVVNTMPTKITVKINRHADGRINTMFSHTDLTGPQLVDSTRYKVVYDGSSSRMKYLLRTEYNTFWGEVNDSTIFTYNASGKIVSRTSYNDMWFVMAPSEKQEYSYDAAGNLTSMVIKDWNGLTFETVQTSTMEYDLNKKAAVVMGDEGYIILTPQTTAPNFLTKSTTVRTGAGTFVITTSETNFNNFNRPTSLKLHITPEPPGYSQHASFFYE